MGTQYLIDSNVVIDYLQGRFNNAGMKFMNHVINDVPKLSVITKIEVLGFSTTIEAYALLTDFFDDSQILNLSEQVVEETIKIRKSHKIKLPDAIIAATAIAFNLTLLTRNKADFRKIDTLDCLDVHEV